MGQAVGGTKLPTTLAGFGERSGIYWALNPDNDNIVWSTPGGSGGADCIPSSSACWDDVSYGAPEMPGAQREDRRGVRARAVGSDPA